MIYLLTRCNHFIVSIDSSCGCKKKKLLKTIENDNEMTMK